MQIIDRYSSAVVTCIRDGGVVVLRTDTLYGIVARASDQAVVERVYAAKGRDASKSPIVLIASVDQLFEVPSDIVLRSMNKYWPGPVSIIVPSTDAPAWIARDNASVAYRIPDDSELRELLRETGPLIAPSANPQGQPPALTVQEAVDYFGDRVDIYVDGGRIEDGQPSRLARIDDDGGIEWLR